MRVLVPYRIVLVDPGRQTLQYVGDGQLIELFHLGGGGGGGGGRFTRAVVRLDLFRIIGGRDHFQGAMPSVLAQGPEPLTTAPLARGTPTTFEFYPISISSGPKGWRRRRASSPAIGTLWNLSGRPQISKIRPEPQLERG